MRKPIGIVLIVFLIIGMMGSLGSAETIVYSSGFQGVCKQGISNGFYYMYRDIEDGGKVKEFPAFNIKSTSEDLTVNMAWTLSKTKAFPFMTNYSTHPEVGYNPILQWRAPSNGTVLYRTIEMGATFYTEDGEVRKSAIFMNDKVENADGVTVTLYLNDKKNSPIKQGLVSHTSDFPFDETIKVKAGDKINLEYDSNTSKTGDATYGLFELTFIEEEAATPTASPTTKPTVAPTEEVSSDEASLVESEAESEVVPSDEESMEESVTSEADSSEVESAATSETEKDDEEGFPVWAIILIAIVVVGGAGAVFYVIKKNKK